MLSGELISSVLKPSVASSWRRGDNSSIKFKSSVIPPASTSIPFIPVLPDDVQIFKSDSGSVHDVSLKLFYIKKWPENKLNHCHFVLFKYGIWMVLKYVEI